MKKILVSILSLLATIASTSQTPKENALLWKIESKNESIAPSYLFGTFHLLCKTDFELSDTIKHLIQNSKSLFLEIDTDDPKLTSKMMQHIKMKDGKTLKDFYSAEEYDKVAVLFKTKTGISLDIFNSYKPFLLTSMLYPSMLGCNTITFEKELEHIAKQDSIEIKGLETIEDQINVFEEIPYHVQAKMFKKALLSIDESHEQMQQLVALYKQQNINALHKDVKGDTDLGKYENNLLNKRNKNWISVIENEVNNSATFFAVGAGHLAGKKGVISLLRKKGYKVTAVIL